MRNLTLAIATPCCYPVIVSLSHQHTSLLPSCFQLLLVDFLISDGVCSLWGRGLDPQRSDKSTECGLASYTVKQIRGDKGPAAIGDLTSLDL